MTDVLSARDTDVVTAWAAVMADVSAVAKADRNTQQNFSFRGIDAVMNAVGPALRAHGVVVIPTVEACAYRDFTTKSGTLMHECTLRVTFTVYGPNGGTLRGTACGESADAGDKATAKAHSVAYRTFLLQALTIPTDDPDPDSFSYERSTPAAPRLLLSPKAQQNLRDRCEKIGASVVEVVKAATGGRTIDPAGVFEDEIDAVKQVIDELTPADEGQAS